MLKVSPIPDYPTEDGCFLQGNHYSPVAVVVLLNAPYGKLPPEVQSIPPEIEKLVRVAIEMGATLAGTLQTENIGIEKIVCNVVGNPAPCRFFSETRWAQFLNLSLYYERFGKSLSEAKAGKRSPEPGIRKREAKPCSCRVRGRSFQKYLLNSTCIVYNKLRLGLRCNGRPWREKDLPHVDHRR